MGRLGAPHLAAGPDSAALLRCAHFPLPRPPRSEEEELDDFVNVDSLQSIGINAADVSRLKAA